MPRRAPARRLVLTFAAVTFAAIWRLILRATT
jgi:hypothetical protein